MIFLYEIGLPLSENPSFSLVIYLLMDITGRFQDVAIVDCAAAQLATCATGEGPRDGGEVGGKGMGLKKGIQTHSVLVLIPHKEL